MMCRRVLLAVSPNSRLGRAATKQQRCMAMQSTASLKTPAPTAIRPEPRSRDALSTPSRDSTDRWTTAYIALGSNMGDRVAEIEQACHRMNQHDICVERTSSLWETEPMYHLDQDRFLNAACEVRTKLEPLALLDQLQNIERSMGRRKLVDKGPRNIDLDILLYGGYRVEHPRLQVPHVGIVERDFVLRPLAQLIPNRVLELGGPPRTVQGYLDELQAGEPLSSVTPLASSRPTLTPLSPSRKTHVMAILNLTPDSFSDGGVHNLENLASTVKDMIRAGASVIDVGGQSTAPGRLPVTADEEAARLIPAIKLIRSLPEARDIIISVDTFRASVAVESIACGAHVVNDVSAGTLDADMLPTVARLGTTICLTHMRGTPRTMATLASYPDGLVPTVASELSERVAAAEKAGIRRWRIMLDPGIGFAKTHAHNLELLRHLDDLRRWPGLEGIPWLVGASRKAFIGAVTGAERPADRTWGTAATVAAAVQGGADMVRVHDAKEMAMVAAMSDAIWRPAE